MRMLFRSLAAKMVDFQRVYDRNLNKSSNRKVQIPNSNRTPLCNKALSSRPTNPRNCAFARQLRHERNQWRNFKWLISRRKKNRASTRFRATTDNDRDKTDHVRASPEKLTSNKNNNTPSSDANRSQRTPSTAMALRQSVRDDASRNRSIYKYTHLGSRMWPVRDWLNAVFECG